MPEVELLMTCEATAELRRTPRTCRKRVLIAAVPIAFGVTTLVKPPANCSTTLRPNGRCAEVDPAYAIA